MSKETEKYGRDVADVATSYDDAMSIKKLVLKSLESKKDDKKKT